MMVFIGSVNHISQNDQPYSVVINCSQFLIYGRRYVFNATTSFTHGNITKSSWQSTIFTGLKSMYITLNIINVHSSCNIYVMQVPKSTGTLPTNIMLFS